MTVLLHVVLQFEQFARTVGDAAVDQQQRTRQALSAFADHISSSARKANATWPMYRLPDFELHAGNRRSEAGVEIVVFLPMLNRKM